jgi:type II secretory pathway pseudopilin PulG
MVSELKSSASESILDAPDPKSASDTQRRDLMTTQRRTRSADDGGFSLVEIVVSISLMGLGVIALLGAAFASSKSTTTGRTSAELLTVMQNAADRVNRADPGCDYSVFVQAAVQAKGWDASHAVATYQYYDGGTGSGLAGQGNWVPATPGPLPTDACPGGARTPRLVQLVTITVTDLTGTERSIQVVKSDV